LLSINAKHVYITHPVVDSYARETDICKCVNVSAVRAAQPLHLVVCKNCIAPTKAKSL